MDVNFMSKLLTIKLIIYLNEKTKNLTEYIRHNEKIIFFRFVKSICFISFSYLPPKIKKIVYNFFKDSCVMLYQGRQPFISHKTTNLEKTVRLPHYFEKLIRLSKFVVMHFVSCSYSIITVMINIKLLSLTKINKVLSIEH